MNLKELAKARGTNIKRVAEACEVPASTLYAISSRDTDPDNIGIGLFLKIADSLGMTAEALRTALKDGLEEAPASEMLSVEELELVSLFRRIDGSDRESFINVTRTLALAGDIKKGAAIGSAPQAE